LHMYISSVSSGFAASLASHHKCAWHFPVSGLYSALSMIRWRYLA
jgi:hypothetical protein